jgi:AraC family transcriptional activator of pobA
MEPSVTTSDIAQLQKLVAEFSSHGDDYVFTHLTSTDRLINQPVPPIRISGMAWILVIKGSFQINLNLDPVAVEAGSVVILMPDTIISEREVTPDIDAYLLMLSPEFMRTINIDPNVMMTLPTATIHEYKPVLPLSGKEQELMKSYFELIHHNTLSNPDGMYVKSIARNLMSAMIYQMVQFVVKHIKVLGLEPIGADRPRSRRSTYVKDFMLLLKKFHKQERSVSFYAQQLYITTKYLSNIVKEATGRSAAQWIDEFVILEAKNLLRFSGKTIKQVSYELNFSNQSAFGKYFKLITGMSPSEYIHS